MHGQMPAEFVGASESLGTVGPCADVWLFTGVCTHVGLEMVGAGELALAYLALEGTDAGVLPAVASELVRSRESLAAALVLANIWLFSGVLPNVHLEVRELEVALGAAGIQAHEWLPLLVVLGVGTHLLADKSSVGSDTVGRQDVAGLVSQDVVLGCIGGRGDAVSWVEVVGSSLLVLLAGVGGREGED